LQCVVAWKKEVGVRVVGEGEGEEGEDEGESEEDGRVRRMGEWWSGESE
jgi:hypothetical protein